MFLIFEILRKCSILVALFLSTNSFKLLRCVWSRGGDASYSSSCNSLNSFPEKGIIQYNFQYIDIITIILPVRREIVANFVGSQFNIKKLCGIWANSYCAFLCPQKYPNPNFCIPKFYVPQTSFILKLQVLCIESDATDWNLCSEKLKIISWVVGWYLVVECVPLGDWSLLCS